MRSRVYETVERPSVCLSHCLIAAAACGGFAADRHVGRKYQLTAVTVMCPVAAAPQHGAQQQTQEVSRFDS